MFVGAELSRSRTERRRMVEEQGYDATIRPWKDGWEILHINGPGVVNGATQAAMLDDVEYMVRDYVCCGLDLDSGEDDDDWDEGVIPVRLTLDLEPDHHYGTRLSTLDLMRGDKVVTLIEETTWWTEDPAAE